MRKTDNDNNDLTNNFTNYNEPSRGSLLSFLGGLCIFFIGIYMIFQNTILTTGFNLTRVIGFTPNFGLVLLPLLIGIIILFFKGSSILGWLVLSVGVLIILMGILMGLKISFMPVTLLEGICMFGMTAAGIGLILRGLFRKNS